MRPCVRQFQQCSCDSSATNQWFKLFVMESGALLSGRQVWRPVHCVTCGRAWRVDDTPDMAALRGSR